jgi:hypothetical protein
VNVRFSYLCFGFWWLREFRVCAAIHRRSVCNSIADFHERSDPSS